jgi:uncharacterized protein
MWRPQLLILQATPYCNINCRYCYLHDRQDRRVMSDEVVDAICKKILANVAPDAAPTIVWHAGEPTVIPVAWYRRAHERLKAAAPHAAGFRIQSNGIAISNEWINFLRDTDTRIGLSIDGPQRFHDARRKTKTGGGTWTLVMKSLRRLQECGIEPNVISVLHPDFLSAADEFYSFYKDHEITDVSFSIDEAQGANRSSSFEKEDQKPAVTAFFVGLLARAFADRYPLRIRDIERMSNILAGNACLDNEQLEAWQVVVVAANGDVTTFSPEFLDLAPETHNNLRFGNILADDLHVIFKNERVTATQLEIRQGVEICRSSCRYFQVCGGGAPANKLAESDRLASGETVFCRHSIQSAADALIEFLWRVRASRSAEEMLSRTAVRPPAVALGRATH